MQDALCHLVALFEIGDFTLLVRVGAHELDFGAFSVIHVGIPLETVSVELTVAVVGLQQIGVCHRVVVEASLVVFVFFDLSIAKVVHDLFEFLLDESKLLFRVPLLIRVQLSRVVFELVDYGGVLALGNDFLDAAFGVSARDVRHVTEELHDIGKIRQWVRDKILKPYEQVWDLFHLGVVHECRVPDLHALSAEVYPPVPPLGVSLVILKGSLLNMVSEAEEMQE